ncbi:hypothetical protein Goari_019610, partial [Gossypium aridum]|nr:hypothetical protein [Gossypium aridum]
MSWSSLSMSSTHLYRTMSLEILKVVDGIQNCC